MCFSQSTTNDKQRINKKQIFINLKTDCLRNGMWCMNKISEGNNILWVEKLICFYVTILSIDVLVSYLRVFDAVIENIISTVCAKNILHK